MRISQLSLAGRGAWPDLHLDTLKPQLNVFYAAPQGGKSTVARLASHLLYGKSDSPWRQHFGQSVPLAEGSISLVGSQGQFVLRRHGDPGSQERLTIASADGGAVDSQSVRSLLSGLDPELASQLFAVDFAETPAVERLLSETFSRQFMATDRSSTNFLPTEQKADPNFPIQQACCNSKDVRDTVEYVDRRRVDQLVQQRDAVAQQIEQQLSVRRKESGVLERELVEVDAELTGQRQQAKLLRSQLREVESQLAEIEARLRYFSLETTVHRDASEQGPGEHSCRQLEELDTEIARCRRTLNDLQAREAVVRTELAQLSPDGTADAVTCLVDGRTTLTVMERLLDDLDAEVAQLARANEPGRCFGADAHAKFLPVAEMLRHQIYTLCGQLTEQERGVRRQQALAESHQLMRTQADMGERLEQLLSRRELLVQQARRIGQPVALSPQPPVAEHCRCDRHGPFVLESEALRPGSVSRQRVEGDAQGRRGTLERERAQLVDTLTALQLDVDRLEVHWKDLQHQRSRFLGGAAIEDRQLELDRLEALIRQTLQPASEPVATSQLGIWRASDVLAQLTDGQLVQIHLARHGACATVVDRAGRTLEIESLTPAQHDAMYLAITLALVGSYARSGIRLPLILDEPFLRQEPASAAIMVGVLEEFARAGHQLLVFTEDSHARRRFDSIGTEVFDLEALRREPVGPTTLAARPAPETARATTSTRVVRETTDGRFQTPTVRLAPVLGDRGDEVFYLAESSLLSEFPVLGSETGDVFTQIGIGSVGELLAANASEVARRLARSQIQPKTVRLWQTHMGLMCFVPELTLGDAQLLAANGIDSPDDLLDADVDELLERVKTFLSSDRGRRLSSASSARDRWSRSRLSSWIRGAGLARNRWNRFSSRVSQNRMPRSDSRSSRTQAVGRATRISQRSSSSSRERQFYLQLESPAEDAPSIGPKTAQRLIQVGIRSVADLLNADPESTAEELNASHIKAETVADWQHQARLVCRIPQLRGFGSQLFVACGFTEPEQISGSDAEQVVTKILAYCQTKKGQRILRSGDPPSRNTIEEWIEGASHTRPLEVA